MSTQNLPVKVTSRKESGHDVFEATVALPGARPTKLTRKSDGSSSFASRSAATNTARTFAKQYGFADVVDSSVKVAAKKVKTSKPKVKAKAKTSPKTSPSTT